MPNCLLFLYFPIEGRNYFKIALDKFSSLPLSVPIEKKSEVKEKDSFVSQYHFLFITLCLFWKLCHTYPTYIQCDKVNNRYHSGTQMRLIDKKCHNDDDHDDDDDD